MSMLKLGTAKTDITAFKKGIGMLGYGQYFNIMEDIETRLYARSFVLESPDGGKVAIVVCELGFITPSVKRGVIKELKRHHPERGFSDRNVLLNAQHTHSGPSGFSHHGLYNMTTPGFVLEIYRTVVEGIVRAIVEADDDRRNVRMHTGRGAFAPDKEVGFQRSLRAYRQNPEAEDIDESTLHLGIDREMTLLRFTDGTGSDVASINWFGTHPTNLSNTNNKVCSDNKGYAASFLEEEMGDGYVGAFAQGSCGDVTPKFTPNPAYTRQHGKWDGKFADEVESAKYNGRLQFEQAMEILGASDRIDATDIDTGLLYTDFANVNVDPLYTGGRENVRTSPACLGVSFLMGTRRDGPGMLEPLTTFTRWVVRLMKGYEYVRSIFMPKEWGMATRQKYTAQGAKDIIIEAGDRKILATRNISRLIVPSWADELIKNLKEFHKRGALDENPWTPQVLPLQIIKLGPLAICAFPFEVTTIAAQRLRKGLEDILVGHNGYREVILMPYSNAYNGYLTTYEEYQVQEYEGGHTVFGEWTLAAVQTRFAVLAREMLKPASERSLSNDVLPVVFTKDHLNRFAHYKGQYAIRREKQREREERARRKKLGRIQKRIEKLERKKEKIAGQDD